MQFHSNIKSLATSYDYFVFDVWGVIHDGSQLYPNVLEAITFLHKAGKKICFLSNAPRRAKKVCDLLQKFDISRDLYDFVLTSGEASYLDLEQNQQRNFNDFSKKYFYIGPKKDLDLLDGLQYEITSDAASAGFAITTGFDHDNSTLEEKLPQLAEIAKHKLPLICVNPDLIVVKQSGQEMICAGLLAQHYSKNGGTVIYYGKPFAKVYEMVLKKFNVTDKTKVIAIGDGPETDIKGANDFGIDSAFVTGGILANKLGVKYGEMADPQKLQEVCDAYKIFPTHVIAGL